jgi:hypothetical protein
MSTIINAARDLLAVISAMTGTRASGVVTVTASGADVELYEGEYAVPVLNGSYRDDLVVKVGEGPSTASDGRTYWTVTSGGTDVTFISNLGGARHNTIVKPASGDTKIAFDPPRDGIASAVVKTSFTGGLDATGLGALQDAFMYQQFEGDPTDLANSNMNRLPGALIIWRGSDAADGASVAQTYRMRMSATQTLMKMNFDLLIFVERNESDHLRRLQGLYLLDLATGYLTDRVRMDGRTVSAPSGVQVQRQFVQALQGADNYVRVYIYGLSLSVMGTFTMTDLSSFVDLENFVVDIIKPDDDLGDIAIVGDGSPGEPGMKIDNT